MAYYVRTATTGRKGDPRSYTYVIYNCDVCGEESQFPLVPNFQFRERKCQHCHCLNSTDKKTALNTERQQVLKQITELNARLMEIETELCEFNQREIHSSQLN